MAEINLITGDLTVSGSTSLLSNTYIPSGYINQSFSITRGTDNSIPYRVKYLKNNGTETFSILDPLATGMRGYIEITNSNLDQLRRHINTQKFTIETGNSLNNLREAYGTSFLNATGVTVPYTAVSGPVYSRAKFKLMTLNERIEHIENSGAFALMPNDKIGFGTYAPQEKVHVNGNLRVQRTGYFNKLIVNNKEVIASDPNFISRDLQETSVLTGLYI